MKTRILLADDHRIIRDGLRALIAANPGMEVVAEARTGREAIEMARRHAPDVIAMDLGMPDGNGLLATRTILGEMPHVRIVMLSAHSDRNYVEEALRLGARAYLLKDCAFQDFLRAVHAVTAGGQYLTKGLVHDRHVCGSVTENDTGCGLSALTARESEVLQLTVDGMTAKKIAKTLGIGIKTVQTHQYRIKHRLGLPTMADLIKFAIQHGVLIPGEEPLPR